MNRQERIAAPESRARSLTPLATEPLGSGVAIFFRATDGLWARAGHTRRRPGRQAPYVLSTSPRTSVSDAPSLVISCAISASDMQMSHVAA